MSEFINQTTMDPIFSKMLSMAKEYFSSNSLKNYEFHQCFVLSTIQDEYKIFSLSCNSVEELIDQSCSILLQGKVTTIKKIVCMWEGYAIEIPSYQFMKKLCELNTENKKAQILLGVGTDSYVSKRIVDIIG